MRDAVIVDAVRTPLGRGKPQQVRTHRQAQVDIPALIRQHLARRLDHQLSPSGQAAPAADLLPVHDGPDVSLRIVVPQGRPSYRRLDQSILHQVLGGVLVTAEQVGDPDQRRRTVSHKRTELPSRVLVHRVSLKLAVTNTDV